MSGQNWKTNEYALGNAIRYLLVDSSVLMKIANHEKLSANHQGWGQLMGWVKEDYIE